MRANDTVIRNREQQCPSSPICYHFQQRLRERFLFERERSSSNDELCVEISRGCCKGCVEGLFKPGFETACVVLSCLMLALIELSRKSLSSHLICGDEKLDAIDDGTIRELFVHHGGFVLRNGLDFDIVEVTN